MKSERAAVPKIPSASCETNGSLKVPTGMFLILTSPAAISFELLTLVEIVLVYCPGLTRIQMIERFLGVQFNGPLHLFHRFFGLYFTHGELAQPKMSAAILRVHPQSFFI